MDDKFEVLSAKLAQEPAGTFLLERNTPKILRDLCQAGRAVVIEAGGAILACAFLFETADPQVCENGTLWVDPAHRGGHLASVLYSLRSELCRGHRRFTINHDPKVAHLALANGAVMATKDTWFSHIPFACSCGPCDRVADKEACPHRAQPGQCQMFVWV